jgi:hypothetical protein
VNSDRVLASAHLQWDTLVRDETRLEPTTVACLVQAAIAATGKPWLGLDLGWQAPISAHGDLAYAAVTAPDLGTALTVLARYGALRDDTFTWTFARHAQGATFLGVQRTDWGAANTFVMDTVVAAFLRVLEAAIGYWPEGVRLCLPIPKPSWAAQYARVSPLRSLLRSLACHLILRIQRLHCRVSVPTQLPTPAPAAPANLHSLPLRRPVTCKGWSVCWRRPAPGIFRNWTKLQRSAASPAAR